MRSIFVVLIGLGVAGGAVWLAQQQIEGERAARLAEEAEESRIEMTEVLVARRSIPFGGRITEEHLTTQQWPAEFVPAGMFTTRDDIVDDERDPRRARRAISAGEPLLRSKVSDFGETVTIVQTLGPNRRAVAIRVDAVSSVGGFVTPGDRVDVMLTQTRNGELETGVVVQDLRVIGTDQDTDETRDDARVASTVTLDVTADEGQKLALAQRAGSLSLSLRTLEDGDELNIGVARLSDLLLAPVAADDDEPAARRPEIRVRRGRDSSTVTFN